MKRIITKPGEIGRNERVLYAGNHYSGTVTTRNPTAFAELERAVEEALSSYCNVHRGTGHKSMVTSDLLEHAREVILDYFGWNDGRHTVVFCTPLAATQLMAGLAPSRYRLVSSKEMNLSLGIRALAVETRVLPPGPPFMSGGGTVKFVLPRAVIWADAPDRFEAGTPSIINSITLAKALQIRQTLGHDVRPCQDETGMTAEEILYNDEFTEFSGLELLDHLLRTLSLIAGRPVTPLDRLAALLRAGTPSCHRSDIHAKMAAFSAEAVRRFYSLPTGKMPEEPENKYETR